MPHPGPEATRPAQSLRPEAAGSSELTVSWEPAEYCALAVGLAVPATVSSPDRPAARLDGAPTPTNPRANRPKHTPKVFVME